MDLPTLPENQQLELDLQPHVVDFDDTVELIVPPPDGQLRGRPRVELRKMSAHSHSLPPCVLPTDTLLILWSPCAGVCHSASTTSPQSATSMTVSLVSPARSLRRPWNSSSLLADAPYPSPLTSPPASFIPNQPRRFCLRLPSFTRSISPPPLVTRDCPIKSCLARTTSRDSASTSRAGAIAIPGGHHQHRIGRTRSLDQSSAPTSSSFSSLLSTSELESHLSALSTSPPTSYVPQQPRARRLSTSSSSTGTRSLPPSPGSIAESVFLPLRKCCAKCQRATDAALKGETPERFSPGALKKHEADLEEAAKDDEMKATWRRGSVGGGLRVDEVQKKREGVETGLRETEPPIEDDEPEYEAASPAAIEETAGELATVGEETGSDWLKSSTPPSSILPLDPSLPTVDSPLSTPMTITTTEDDPPPSAVSTTATTISSPSDTLPTPPLSPCAHPSPLPQALSDKPTHPVPSAASPSTNSSGKHKFWHGLSMPNLHHLSLKDLRGGGGSGSATSPSADNGLGAIAGGHGRF